MPQKATLKTDKPYIWVTWLAGLLGGKECAWAVWFKAHHKYEKFEEMGGDLAKWSADHDRMMRERTEEFEEMGYEVRREKANDFKLEGAAAIVAGKPDIVALEPSPGRRTILVDGKTGRQRNSDWWQVVFYLFALPKCRPDLVDGRSLEGEVQYKRGDVRNRVKLADVTPAVIDDIVKTIKLVAADQPPKKAPSRDECRSCNIGKWDCPERVSDQRVTTKTDAF